MTRNRNPVTDDLVVGVAGDDPTGTQVSAYAQRCDLPNENLVGDQTITLDEYLAATNPTQGDQDG